jgi:nucleotide-binding universal stress UspA family protein
VKELVMNMLTATQSFDLTAGTVNGAVDTPVYAVVGYDGSGSAKRALDAAARLLHDRPGGMEIVYVAHMSVMAGAAVSADATARLSQSFDDTTRELSGEVRAHLQDSHLRGAAQRWHFQRRNGGIADELLSVAEGLRDRHGPDASVVIVVGRSEHGYHHVLGSVPQALERHDHFPVIVIP